MIDPEVFTGKKLSDLLKDIHDNSKLRSDNIETLIANVLSMVHSAGDMTVMGPIARDLYETLVKSDESSTKIATIVQRIIASETNNGNTGDTFLSEAEKDALLANSMATLRESEKETTAELANIVQDVVKKLPLPKAEVPGVTTSLPKIELHKDGSGKTP